MSLPSFRPFLLAALLAVAALASHAVAQEPTCAGFDRPIVFAELDYDSVNILTAIARFLLEEGFGCATDTIPGTTLPLLQGSVRGDIDVTMEIWTDNTPDFWREALAQGRVRELQPVFDDAAQGFFVPRYLVEGDADRGIAAAAPDLRSVADLPRYAALFRDPEQPDKGRLYNCVIGWFCEGINNVKFHVYGLDDHFTNFRAGTGIALETTMEAAYARGEPWLGYYWEPTGILGRLDMLRLDEPPYSDACFEHMLAHVDTPERATEACEYAVVVAVVGLGSRFASTVPEPIEAVLDAMYVPTATINRLLAHMAETGADTSAAARHFLATEGERWSSWLDGLDPGVRERIDAALR
jgi:glycine betaine/proline transport system substrate-binding protein